MNTAEFHYLLLGTLWLIASFVTEARVTKDTPRRWLMSAASAVIALTFFVWAILA